MSAQELISSAKTIEISPLSHLSDALFKDVVVFFMVLSRLGKRIRFTNLFPMPPSFAWLNESLFPTQAAFPTNLTIIVDNARVSHNKEALRSAMELLSPLQIPGVRLLERALSAIEYVAPQNICALALEQSDFKETQTNPRNIVALVQELKSWARQEISLLAFVGSTGLCWMPQKDMRAKIAGRAKTTGRGNWLLCDFQTKNPAANKQAVLSALSSYGSSNAR